MGDDKNQGGKGGNWKKKHTCKSRKPGPFPHRFISTGRGRVGGEKEPAHSILFASPTLFSTPTHTPSPHETCKFSADFSLQSLSGTDLLPRWDIASGQYILQPQLGGGESRVGSGIYYRRAFSCSHHHHVFSQSLFFLHPGLAGSPCRHFSWLLRGGRAPPRSASPCFRGRP